MVVGVAFRCNRRRLGKADGGSAAGYYYIPGLDTRGYFGAESIGVADFDGYFLIVLSAVVSVYIEMPLLLR